MSNLSERIQKRLDALAISFTAEIPVRMRDIADAATSALGGEPEPDRFAQLRHHVHKLAGAAASFGFPHVTACAKRLEHALDDATTHIDSFDDSARRRLRMLVSELSEAARSKPGSEESEEDLELLGQVEEIQVLDPKRTVLLRIASAKLSAKLAEQLSMFGFQIATIERPEQITDHLSGDRQVAVIADASVILDDPSVSESLASTKAKHETRLHILFVSDRDDFDMRLLAVRAGGEAFFSTPADTLRLLDTVDALTSESKETPYHVLIVDDDKEQVSFHALILQQAGMITSVVSDPANMFPILIDAKPDLILMDMYMPGCSGLELATIIRQQEAFVGVPIVFLSIESDREMHLEAISRGGDGFLMKPISSKHLITTVRSRIDRTRSMRFFMERDSLTGLLNHTHLNQSLSKEMQRAERVGRSLCFVMIDLDHFKDVNDSYGHLTGDRVLKSLARYLQDRLRKTDVVGRYGGEEFGVILFNVVIEDAVRLMDTVRKEYGRIEHQTGDSWFNVTFSCGVASFPDHDGPALLVEAADRALYRAKEEGRNRVVQA